MAPFKQDFADQLTSTGVVFAAIEVARSVKAGQPTARSYPPQEFLGLHGLATRVTQHPDAWRVLRDAFYVRGSSRERLTALVGADGERVRDVYPSAGMQIVFARLAAEGGLVTPTRLVRALLLDSARGVFARFASVQLEPVLLAELIQLDPNQPDRQPTQATASKTEAVPLGRSVEFRRELGNSDPLGLEIDAYAAASAVVLRTAAGEFAFALFGPWGIGKTVLSKRTELFLTNPRRLHAELRGRGVDVDETDPAFTRSYEVVRFSAWKYRRIPELWVHLYETFRDACWSGPWLGRLGRATRSAINRHGFWPNIVGLVLLGLVGVPVSALVLVGYPLLAAVGIGSIVYFAQVLRGGVLGRNSLTRHYWNVARHRERLGMQGLIGDDLRALILAWIPSVPRMDRRFAAAVCLLLTIAAIWGYAITRQAADVSVPGWVCNIVASCSPGWLAAFVRVFVLVAWAALCLAVLISVYRPRRSTERILLVVDDVDRCGPQEIVDLIEALKLLLEDQALHDRVQVMLLADETVLNHAVREKLESFIATKGSRTAEAALVVQEHQEKLFLCHLRLPPLSSADVADLTRLFASMVVADDTLVIEARSPPSRTAVGDGPDAIYSLEGSLARPEFRGARVATGSASSEQPVRLSGARFTAAEIDELTSAVPAIVMREGQRATPRSIRSFLFKYQLCRLLLLLVAGPRTAERFSTRDVLDALQREMTTLPAGGVQAEAQRATLAAIARQVA